MLMRQSLVYFGTSGELEAPALGICSKNLFSLSLVMKRVLCKNYSFTNLFALYFQAVMLLADLRNAYVLQQNVTNSEFI